MNLKCLRKSFDTGRAKFYNITPPPQKKKINNIHNTHDIHVKNDM